jgi:hypothetical protein
MFQCSYRRRFQYRTLASKYDITIADSSLTDNDIQELQLTQIWWQRGRRVHMLLCEIRAYGARSL